MDPLTLALMASIPQMLGGVLAKGEHSKYAKLLDSTKTKVPESMETARGIFEGLSEQGLPGFESTKSDILGTVGSSMEMAKGATDSPAALLGAITSAQGNVAGEIRKLGVQDEAAGLQNKLNFANFLSKVQAPTEMSVDQYNNDMKLAAGKERMLGTSELLGGISQGVGSGISAYGTADMREKFSEMFTNFGGDETTNKEVIGGEMMDSPMKQLELMDLIDIGDYFKA